MCSASTSAATDGSGTVRRELPVFSGARRPLRASCRSMLTSRRRKSTSATRRASSSLIRSPSPAWARIIARTCAAAASAHARTWAMVSGTNFGLSSFGSDSRAARLHRVPGDQPVKDGGGEHRPQHADVVAQRAGAEDWRGPAPTPGSRTAGP